MNTANDNPVEEPIRLVGAGVGVAVLVLYAPMTVAEHPVSADQLIVTFTDMTRQGGNLTIWFADQIATIPFQVAP